MKREKPTSRNRTMDMHSTEYAHSMARGLGWFSIGLGLAEVLAPRALTRGLGMEGNEQLVQAYGLREIATGIGILSSDQPAPWIWGRVGGDARYGHARRRTAGGQSEERERGAGSCRRCRRHRAGCCLRGLACTSCPPEASPAPDRHRL